MAEANPKGLSFLPSWDSTALIIPISPSRSDPAATCGPGLFCAAFSFLLPGVWS